MIAPAGSELGEVFTGVETLFRYRLRNVLLLARADEVIETTSLCCTCSGLQLALTGGSLPPTLHPLSEVLRTLGRAQNAANDPGCSLLFDRQIADAFGGRTYFSCQNFLLRSDGREQARTHPNRPSLRSG